jgi:integrase/recombinase XerC
VARGEVAGAASLVLVSGAELLRPDLQLFDAMLVGWRDQQLSRNLAPGTVEAGASVIARFQIHSGEFPWCWTPAHLEEWTSDLRAVRHVTQSTVRNYQKKVRLFLRYVCDPVYGWDRECETRFGTYPVQICHDWNTAVHRSEFEAQPARRALTRHELQLLFDAADDAVDEIVRRRRKGFGAAYRDAVMVKVAYAWGLRRRELIHLDVHDFARNPKAAEFGEFGVCNVRFGKANAGSPPKRRGVLTVMPWSVEVIEQWVNEVWPHCRQDASVALWPSERQERINEHRFNVSFSHLSQRAGLPTGLSPHCLRHSYVISTAPSDVRDVRSAA